jgi:hypothetical protein
MDDLNEYEARALAAIDAAPHGAIHFQLCPFSNATLRSLECRGLVVVGRDLYVRLSSAPVSPSTVTDEAEKRS